MNLYFRNGKIIKTGGRGKECKDTDSLIKIVAEQMILKVNQNKSK